MRTTLTLDEDVAGQLRKLCREREEPFKLVVNEALKRGLDEMRRPESRAPYRTEPWSVGRCFLPDLDDVAGVLAWGEGDAHK